MIYFFIFRSDIGKVTLLYLGDHGYVNEEADDAADGCNHLSP